MSETPPTTPPSYSQPDGDDGTLAPNDLLDNEGSVSTAKVRQAAASTNRVASDECAQWRRQLRRGEGVEAVGGEYTKTTVRHHVHGECDHDHGEAALEYDYAVRERTVGGDFDGVRVIGKPYNPTAGCYHTTNCRHIKRAQTQGIPISEPTESAVDYHDLSLCHDCDNAEVAGDE